MNLETISILCIGGVLIYLLIKDSKNNKRLKYLSNNIESISELFDGELEVVNVEENDLISFKMKKITISIGKILKTVDEMKNKITHMEKRISLLEEINEQLEEENDNLQKRITMYKKLSKNMVIGKSFIDKL